MADKFKGKVKWYSIRKGFGFITPNDDKAPTKEDVFFHQSSIVSEVKNKFLETDYEVEFDVYTDDEGKYRCKNVTAPGGGPCEIPKRNKKKRNRGKGEKKDGATDDEGAKSGDDTTPATEKKEGDTDNKNGQKKGRNNRNRNKKKANAGKDGAENKEGESGTDDKKPAGGRKPRKRFDENISADVKAKMKDKKLDMRQTSLLVSIEKTRLKFGPDGYAALANADGMMAEGSFVCDDEGKVTLTWKNMLKFDNNEWKTDDPIANTSSGVLVSSFNWTDENVEGLKTIETPESLWGEGKTDPADALQSNNFQMRKCFLAKAPSKPRNRRRPRAKGGKKGEKADGKDEKTNGKDEKTNGKAENGNKKEGEDAKAEAGASS